MSVMISFFSNLVVVKGIVISTKNMFSLVKAGIMYESSQPYGAHIINQLQTFQNYYKSSCLIRVNEKNETFCRRNLYVCLSVSILFLWNKNIRSNSKNKKHYAIDILKEGKNIFYRLLLIIVLVISLLKMWYRHFLISCTEMTSLYLYLYLIVCSCKSHTG